MMMMNTSFCRTIRKASDFWRLASPVSQHSNQIRPYYSSSSSSSSSSSWATILPCLNRPWRIQVRIIGAVRVYSSQRISQAHSLHASRVAPIFTNATLSFRHGQHPLTSSSSSSSIVTQCRPLSQNYLLARRYTSTKSKPNPSPPVSQNNDTVGSKHAVTPKEDENDDKNDSSSSSSLSSSSNNTSNSASTSDPPMWTWMDRYLPQSWQPYAQLARLDKPIGTWLLLWPCCWSTALAHPASVLDHVSLVTLFALGAVTMRGAGCTINDLCDQDIDQAVARTKHRPLAAQTLTNVQAVQFLALQMATGLAVLVSLPHTWYCFQWGIASLPLVFLYPTTKRFFPYPQLILGLCFNWGAWMGWAATYGTMDWAIVAPLYFSGVTWTLVYDTIYAHQDKDDDSKLGLYSTALTFGSDERIQRQILHALAAATWMLWATAGYQAEMVNPALYGVGITAAYGHLVWQMQTADWHNPHNLAARFRSNATTGALVYASLLAGHPPTML